MIDIEVRKSVSVKSHNWRFELDLAKGKEYPDTGRPIGLFINVSVRMFLYMIIMPDVEYYKEIKEILDNRSDDDVRRLRVNVSDLLDLNTKLPILNYLTID